jgi:hypothetical protein
VTQPPPSEPGGYYPPQYSGQPQYPQEYPQQYPQQAPYGSQPPPYGSQPVYGGQPATYGQPAQYGEQPWLGSSTGYPSLPATPPPRPKRSLWSIIGTIRTIGGAVVALGIIGFIVYAFFLGGGPEGVGDAIQDATDDGIPDVGQCITEESLTADETTVVACDAPEAAWRTIGFDGEANDLVFRQTDVEEYCQEFPTTGTVWWIGERGGWGDVVCLEEVTAEESPAAG